VLDPLPSSPLTGVPVAPLRPAQVFLLGLKRNMQIQICDWTGIEADLEHLAAGLRAGLPLIQPFPALALLDDPELQRAAAAAWIREECRANDSKRRIAERVFRRDELGPPASGFVYCCFNSTYKILPDMFACWMRILVRVPGSVLLLYADREETRRNLCQQAQMRGVNPDRILFAGRLPPEEYRAQYRSMDLFLDTLPFNAGTTASDALWAGLPLLTCAGSAFAARMAASLLQTLGLPELVASTLGEYEEIAVRLAQQPAQLADLRQRLAQNRISTPLFDTQAFTRDLESGFMRAWQRHLDGWPPADIRIDRSP